MCMCLYMYGCVCVCVCVRAYARQSIGPCLDYISMSSSMSSFMSLSPMPST